MAEKKRRVHTLAKELNVASKAIIEKCRAEGIEVKNHMHVVTAGLEATIREWFSEGSHDTTLEQAERVDLVKVRKKVKRKAKVAATSTEEAATSTAVLEEPMKVAPPKGVSTEVDVADIGVIVEPPAVSVPTDEPVQEQSGDTRELAAEVAETLPPVSEPASGPAMEPVAEAPAAATDKPTKPVPPKEPAKSAPINIPKPAKLQGPRVVRIERPEDVAPPRRMSRPPRSTTAETGPPPTPTDDERRGPRRSHGRTTEKAAGADAATARRSPRRNVRDPRTAASEQLREWRDRDLIERRERLEHATGRGIGGLRAIEGKQARRSGPRTPIEHVKADKIELTEPVMIKDLSREAGITVAEIVRHLVQDHGQMVGINSSLDAEMAQLVAADFGIELTVKKQTTGLDRLAVEHAAIERKHAEPRPPVVTVLGHVDHGKTSLLDRIRKTDVAGGESGGITQHIGAYQVRTGDHLVTFLDTPGHTAFTAMRARGANMTDVVVLVVAADDGVMPTTIEAINHAKAAKATIVVALNKIDLPHDINKIFAQLTEQGLTPSGEWGGETDVVKTSAVTGEGIDELLSHLAVLSEVMDLKADSTIRSRGTVIEAERKEGLGNVVRLLVQEGTLKTGQFLVCGAAYGRARTLKDDKGKTIRAAGPSTPVEVTGLSAGAAAGDAMFVVENARQAKQLGEEEAARRREESLIRASKPTDLESVLATAAGEEIPGLSVIVKADVAGSVDVLKNALSEYPQDRIKLNILHAGVGAVSESDVVLAQASGSLIIAFHVIADQAIQRIADNAGVSIRTYRVIYAVIDDIRKALEDRLPPEERIEARGRAEVREVFSISKVGRIAGCLVRDGLIARNHIVRVVRDGVIVKEKAPIESLRRFKDDAKEIKSGLECGIRVKRFDDLKPGDIIESYEVVEVAQTLE